MTEAGAAWDARAHMLAISGLRALATRAGVHISRDEAIQLLREQRTVTAAIRHLAAPAHSPEQIHDFSTTHILDISPKQRGEDAARMRSSALGTRRSSLGRALMFTALMVLAIAALSLLLMAWRAAAR